MRTTSERTPQPAWAPGSGSRPKDGDAPHPQQRSDGVLEVAGEVLVYPVGHRRHVQHPVPHLVPLGGLGVLPLLRESKE